MERDVLLKAAEECGFETCGALDVGTLRALPEVRQMCEVNTCGAYGKRWSCPPGCGSIEECEEKMKRYKKGILVQTVGDIEDTMDWEGIMAVKEEHDKRFLNLIEKIRNIADESACLYKKISAELGALNSGSGAFGKASGENEGFLPLGDGYCGRCKECTYPNSPCRFPDRSMSSMEAFGLFVSDVCRKNGIAYNYGPGKMCYTGCVLFN